MRIFSSSYLPKLALVGSLAAALVSCEDPELPEAKPLTESTVGKANVRVINAAPGTTGVITTVDNATAGSALPFMASGVVSINAGQRILGFTDPTNIPSNAPIPSGATTAPARTIYSRSAFTGGTNSTVLVTDQPNRAISGTDQGGIRFLVVADNLAAPAAGKAKVRFFNLSPSLSASSGFGVFNTLSVPPAFLFSARTYRTTTNFNTFTEVNAGAYTLDVRATATATPVVAAKVYTFEAGKIYTLYASGLTGSSTTPLALSVVTHN